jgi:hypothetical protein
MQNGTLWAWGINGAWLGLGNPGNVDHPVQVGTDTNWASAAAGSEYSVAVKTDGTLWQWGMLTTYLPNGSSGTAQSTPVQFDSGYSSVALTHNFEGDTFAIKQDGTLWGWGYNDNGQLGDGTVTSRNEPVQIGTDTNWSSASLAGGYDDTLAVKQDGTLWAWGSNFSGQLGSDPGWSPHQALINLGMIASTVATGQNVQVAIDSGIGFIFSSVTSSGTVTATLVLPGSLPAPANFVILGGMSYDITTDASFSGQVEVCIGYDPTKITVSEQQLRLFHYSGGTWTDITSSVDTVAKKVCGITSSLSAFAIAQPVITTYTITATADANGSISSAGISTVNRGDSITYTITPNEGYQVLSVIVDGANKGSVTSYTFTNVQADHTIAAYFKAVSYTITASAGAGGSISPLGVTTVNTGGSKTFTITPDAGYHIADVLVDTVSQGPTATYAFTNVQANHTISATFAENPWFLIDASAGPNGTIYPSGSGTVLGGTNQKYTITPAAGYRVADVVVDNESKGSLTSYTFYNIQEPHTISVTFTLDVYTIAATISNHDSSTPVHGTITPSGTVTVARGANQTFTIAPDPGYVVYSVLVDGVQKGGVATYTFNNVQANHTIAAYVRPITYTVTTSAGAGGKIIPSGTSTFDIHSSPTFTIAPNAGYSVSDVKVDDVSQGAISSYTFADITQNHTIAATFAANSGYTITAMAGPNGSISPSGSVPVLAGANQKFTFTPNAGSRVADVQVDGVSKGPLTSYTFYNVQGDHSISASFVPDVYTLNVTVAAGGSVTVSGSSIPTTTVNGGESSAVTVNSGANVTLTITPDPGRSVRSLVDNGSYKYGITTYSLTNIRKDHTINVYFK